MKYSSQLTHATNLDLEKREESFGVEYAALQKPEDTGSNGDLRPCPELAFVSSFTVLQKPAPIIVSFFVFFPDMALASFS